MSKSSENLSERSSLGPYSEVRAVASNLLRKLELGSKVRDKVYGLDPQTNFSGEKVTING